MKEGGLIGANKRKTPDEEVVKRVIGIKDKFKISDAAYHQLHMISSDAAYHQLHMISSDADYHQLHMISSDAAYHQLHSCHLCITSNQRDIGLHQPSQFWSHFL